MKCIKCGIGAEFPRASARRCLTFPHSVYSAHRFSSRSYSSPTRCTGFADSPPIDGKLLMQLLYHGELPTPPRFRFMVSVTQFPTVLGQILNFVELCNIFSYVPQGQVLSSSPSDSKLAAFHARWSEKKFSHFIELLNEIIP